MLVLSLLSTMASVKVSERILVFQDLLIANVGKPVNEISNFIPKNYLLLKYTYLCFNYVNNFVPGNDKNT